MSPLPRVPVTVPVIVLLLALHGAAWAGPVPAAEAQDAAPSATALSSPAAETAASGAAGSAMAVEIITEAEAGAEATEGPRGPRRDNSRADLTPAAVPVRAKAPGDDDPWGVRETGKAALQWVKEVKDSVPWLRSEEDTPDAGRAASLDQADWSASSLHGNAERGAGSGPSPLVAGTTVAGASPLNTVGYGEATPPQMQLSTEGNMVRVVIDAIREVLEHPMTWLVVALVVIGALAVKKLDRRPNK